MTVFRRLRILFLLLILFLVAAGTWLSQWRSTSWKKPLVVAIYPVNGDNSTQSEAYVESLSLDVFDDIETFFVDEAEQFGLALKQPVDIVLGPVLDEPPPEPPKNRNLLKVMWWSLKIRWWAWQVGRDVGPPANVQMFVLYHDPKTSPRLAHSLGLQKGLLGVVHAFASPRQAAGNNIVIAHELLHTVGATDKYDPQTNQPVFPMGYAEPDMKPVLPQEFAEIMAGRVPLDNTQFRQARDLGEVMIGEYTAREIRWME